MSYIKSRYDFSKLLTKNISFAFTSYYSDTGNYTLDHYSLNRSAGAKLKEGYKLPST